MKLKSFDELWLKLKFVIFGKIFFSISDERQEVPLCWKKVPNVHKTGLFKLIIVLKFELCEHNGFSIEFHNAPLLLSTGSWKLKIFVANAKCERNQIHFFWKICCNFNFCNFCETDKRQSSRSETFQKVWNLILNFIKTYWKFGRNFLKTLDNNY